jgi:hypothetical protein
MDFEMFSLKLLPTTLLVRASRSCILQLNNWSIRLKTNKFNIFSIFAENKSSMENPIREELNKKHILYEQLFTQFQVNHRTLGDKYINSEGFQDVKIIFDLYSDSFQYKGFNTSNFDDDKLEKILKGFDEFRQKDLISFLIEKLKIKGNASHAEDFEKLLKKKQIKCNWKEILKRKNIFLNICSILQKSSSYNIFSLTFSLMLFISLSMLLFSSAPNKFMEILNISTIKISENWVVNHFANVLLYTFDFDDTMKIIPLNIMGTFILIILKIFMLVIIVNFLIKEFLMRFKL